MLPLFCNYCRTNTTAFGLLWLGLYMVWWYKGHTSTVTLFKPLWVHWCLRKCEGWWKCLPDWACITYMWLLGICIVTLHTVYIATDIYTKRCLRVGDLQKCYHFMRVSGFSQVWSEIMSISEWIPRDDSIHPTSVFIFLESMVMWMMWFRMEWIACLVPFNNLANIKLMVTLIERFMGPIWGSSGADRTQVGSMLTPWALLSGKRMMTTWREHGLCITDPLWGKSLEQSACRDLRHHSAHVPRLHIFHFKYCAFYKREYDRNPSW